MRIDSISLVNFRNYESLDLEFHPGTNLFYGDNAQGKTNILESVYLCGTTRSHRLSRDRDMIRFGQEEAHLRMIMEQRNISTRIDMHLKKNKAKGIAVNAVPLKRAGELIGMGNFIFFSPEDLSIIKSGPERRRRFLDMELCQLDRVYVSSLTGYNRALAQRNRLLHDLSFRPDPDTLATLDVWDSQLANYGKKVIGSRREFAEKLSGIISPIHEKLSGGRETLKVGYEANVSGEEFERELAGSRDRDLKTQTTNVGPHRDDLSFEVLSKQGGDSEWIDIRRYGSQGQQRTAALSVKLAEIELVKEVTYDSPVLLLDDVLSELDSNRQRDLLESIRDIQTLITCTGVQEFERYHFQIDRLFHVEQGHVSVRQ